MNGSQYSVLTASEIDRLIEEDFPYGDLTSRSLGGSWGLQQRHAYMQFAARQPLCVAAVEEAIALAERLRVNVNVQSASGQWLDAGGRILQFDGSAAQLLVLWKIAQNLIEWASGIATLSHQMVMSAKAVNPQVILACTRKSPPLLRRLSSKCVQAGGAALHRTGLSETVLLFAEHMVLGPKALRDNGQALSEAVARLKAEAPERRVVVEVVDAPHAIAAAHAGVEIVQLEKFSPQMVGEIRKVLKEIAPTIKIAVAGGIKLTNIAEYATTGAEILVSSAPYAAPPVDVQVSFQVADEF